MRASGTGHKPIAIGEIRANGAVLDPSIFAEVLGTVSQGVLIAGVDRRIRYVNAAFTAITGHLPEDLIGANCQALQGPQTDPQTVAAIREALDGGVAFTGEILNVRKSGESFWNELTITPLVNAAGVVDHYVGITRDITERRNAETRLREIEVRYRFIFDHVQAAIILHGADTEILYVNGIAADVLGIPQGGLVGSSARGSWGFVREDGSALPPEEYPVNRALAAGGAVRGIVLGHRRPDNGRLVWLMGNACPLLEAGGELRVVVSFVDVTDLREAALERERAKAAAEAASVAKSEFLANMSHEIRTPLTAMIGFSGLLERDESLSGPARLYLNRIVDSGKTLLALVNDILDFSRLEVHQTYLDPHPFDPREAVGDTLQLLSGAAAEKALALRTVSSPELPALVSADSARVKQVLINLLANAVKFTVRGEIVVALDYAPQTSVLSIAVSDTGPGIAQDQLETIFQRFSQVDASVNRRSGGTGLGLAIVRELARLMGGDVDVRSRLNEGSTFTVTLHAPAARAEEAPAQPPAPPTPAAEPNGARVLVVDDVAQNRELVRAILEAAGFCVEEAADGQGAVSAAFAKPYDLILMDMQMPGMDGLAATRAIRSSRSVNAARPILAFSANVLPDQVARCLEAGMDDHIPKPINARELVGKVASWTCGPASEDAA